MTDLLPMEIKPKQVQLVRRAPAAPEQDVSGTIKDAVYILFRYRNRMILFFLAVTAASLIYALTMPDIYSSEARLLVRRGSSLDPTTTGQLVPIWKPWENELNSEYEILTSRDLVEKTVRAIGPEAILGAKAYREIRSDIPRGPATLQAAAPSDSRNIKERDALEAATHKVGAGLYLHVVKKSDILGISYSCEDPVVAQKVVNELIHQYMEKHIEVRRARGAYDFFAQQAERSKKELSDTESSLRQTKNEMGIGSLDGRRNINLNRIALLEQRQETLSAQGASSKAKISTLRSMLDRHRTEDETRIRIGREEYADIGSALLSEKVNLASLQAEAKSIVEQIDGSKPINPSRLESFQERLQQVRSEIAASMGKLNALQGVTSGKGSETNSIPRSDLNGIRSALWLEETAAASYEAESKVLDAQLAEAKREIKQLNDYETRLRWLERQRDQIEAKYKQYTDTLEQTRITQALEEDKISNITIVQPATEPLSADPSYGSLIVLLGLFIGAFGGVGVAFTSGVMDNRVSRPEDITRKLHLPSLASVPMLKGREISPMERKREHQGPVHKGIRGGWEVPGDARPHFETLSYRIKRALQETNRRPIMIGVTSCHGGEGVSSVASNLAITLARQGNDVLLVDGNFGIESARRSVGMDGATAVMEIKLDSAGELIVMEHKLYMLHDDDAASSSAVVSYEEVMRLVRQKATTFAVFDMPPISEGFSALQLAGETDHVILVVEAEGVSVQTVRRAADLLNESGGHVLGVVLNKRRFHVPGWLYRRL